METTGFKNGLSDEQLSAEEPATGVDAPSEEMRRESSFASATSSGTDNVTGLSYVGGQSPRAPLTILGAAIGYYEVLQSVSRKPLSSIRPPTTRGYDDEYQEMHFAPGDVTDIFGVPSNLTRARLRSFQNFRAATSTRLQNLKGRLRPGNYLPLQWTPRHVMLRDKFSFVLGVSHIMISAFWLGKSPSTFYQLYTFKAALLFIIRFVTYRRDKMHYYLLDFCYYANILLIIHAWCLPEWCTLEKILFAYATGPLAWTIVAFRNSMIFHSIDKMTSVFMHTFPMMVVWTQRWYPGDAKHWKTIASKSCESHTATVWELVVIPWIPYAVWAVAYYLKIFVISSKRIQERGYHTLFKYVIRKPNSFFGRANAVLPRGVAPVVYMLWHILFCAVTFVVAMFCWHHYWVHTVFCCSVIAASVWNGGNYYFEVFAHSYLSDTGIPVKVPKARSHSVEVNHMVDPAVAFDESMRARSEGDMAALAEDLATKELATAIDAGATDSSGEMYAGEADGAAAVEAAKDGKKDA